MNEFSVYYSNTSRNKGPSLRPRNEKQSDECACCFGDRSEIYKLCWWQRWVSAEFIHMNGALGSWWNRSICSKVFVYRRCLKKSSRMWFDKNQEWVVQEGYDPKHAGRYARNWKAAQNFDRLDKPATSPDFNPIENVESLLKAMIQ